MTVLLMAGFINLIDVTIVNVALPTLQQSFEASESQIEWVVAAYILVFALCLLPAGRLGDFVGRRRMFILGVVVFTTGSALCGLAPSMPALIAARVLQGIGGGIMTPQTLAIVPSIFPPQERGFVFSLFGLTAGFATVSGPVLGGVLIHADLFGMQWRPIFLVNIPVGLLGIVAALKFIPALPGASDRRIDIAGIALAAITLLLVLLPLVEGRLLGWPWWCWLMLVSAPFTAGLFVAWQYRQARRQQAQLMPVPLLQNRLFLVGVLMIAVLFSGVPGFFFVFAQYLQNGYGLTALQSGLTTLPFSLGLLGASALSIRLAGRWPRRRITAGASCMATGMLCLLWLTNTMGDTLQSLTLAPPLLLGGIGLGITAAPLLQTILSTVDARDAGSASGTLQSFQQVGGAFGVAIMGQLFFAGISAATHAEGSPAIGSNALHDASAAAFTTGLTHAMIYSALAFISVAALVRILPRPASS